VQFWNVSQFLSSYDSFVFLDFRMWAMALHESVKSRLEKDVLDTTPQRIAHMLCPDLTPTEFKAVRKRIYDTVVLGKGLKVEDTAEEIPVASNSQSVHDIEKVRRCSARFRLLIHLNPIIKLIFTNLETMTEVQKMQSLRQQRPICLHFRQKERRRHLQQLWSRRGRECYARRFPVS
jgi:hypothetical protein